MGFYDNEKIYQLMKIVLGFYLLGSIVVGTMGHYGASGIGISISIFNLWMITKCDEQDNATKLQFMKGTGF
jgi:hypothetical protein